jgi:hypothetical protein
MHPRSSARIEKAGLRASTPFSRPVLHLVCLLLLASACGVPYVLKVDKSYSSMSGNRAVPTAYFLQQYDVSYGEIERLVTRFMSYAGASRSDGAAAETLSVAVTFATAGMQVTGSQWLVDKVYCYGTVDLSDAGSRTHHSASFGSRLDPNRFGGLGSLGGALPFPLPGRPASHYRGSIATGIARLIHEVFGTEPLRAALRDRDPDIRDAAERELKT